LPDLFESKAATPWIERGRLEEREQEGIKILVVWA
jgi:hypothetical protein